MVAEQRSADAPSAPGRRPHGSLDREQILSAAQRIIEREGLDGFSMPVLARELGAGVTSTYWYFRTKEDLLAALLDRVTRQMYLQMPPVGDGPWDQEATAYFTAFRELLRATPVYRDVMAFDAEPMFVRSSMAPTILSRLEEGVGLFVRAGLSPEEAVYAFNACAHYTQGHVLGEPLGHGDNDSDSDEDFRFGLHLLVDGIRR